MNPTIFFSVCSLLYSVLLFVTLFSRSEKKNIETKTLKILVVINFISLILEAGGIFLGSNYESLKVLNDIALRGMLVLYALWFTLFTVYVINISKQNKSLDFKKYKLVYLLSLVAILLMMFLPISYVVNDQNVIIYSAGPAVDMLKYYTMLSEIICLVIMFKNSKNVKLLNYSSLFILVVLTTLTAMIQSSYPSLLLMASVQTFVMYIEYINIKKREVLENNKETKK